VGVQKVGWEVVRAGDCNFFYEKGNESHKLGTGFFVQHRIVSAVNRVVSVSDRMSCIILRCRWCNIIVLIARAKREEKSDDSKERFYAELKQILSHFPVYNMEYLVGDFSANWGEGIFANRQGEWTKIMMPG